MSRRGRERVPARHPAKEDSAEERYAYRAAELLCGAEQPGRAAGRLGWHRGQHHVRQRDDEQGQPGTGHDQAGHDGPRAATHADMADHGQDAHGSGGHQQPPTARTRRPYFCASGTATGAPSKQPTLSASAVRPAFSGEKCSPACSQSANIRKKPCRPAPNASSTPSPAANAGMRNSRGRSSGARPPATAGPGRARPRASRAASATAAATPAAVGRHDQAGQPYRRPSSSGYTTATRPAASTAAAGRFGRPAAGSRVSGISRLPADSASSATGTFTKNTARQLQPNRLASVS